MWMGARLVVECATIMVRAGEGELTVGHVEVQAVSRTKQVWYSEHGR